VSWSEAEVLEAVSSGRHINAVGLVDQLPQPERVGDVLDLKLGICRDRSRRAILVEKVDEYKVLITIPNGKSNCDFRVWRYSPSSTPLVKIPTHDDLGRMFIELKKKHKLVDEYLINATIRLLRDRWGADSIIRYYFDVLSDDLKVEVKKFLITLKWVGLQEDVNYPPPKYLGSKMALAVYALLEAGFDLPDIRKIIRF